MHGSLVNLSWIVYKMRIKNIRLFRRLNLIFIKLSEKESLK